MQEILESSMDIVDILEFITNSSALNESWEEVIVGNKSLVYQKLTIHKTNSLIRYFDLIPVGLAVKKQIEKFSGILHINQNQSTSLNLSKNFTLLVPPETSLLISDRNTSTLLVSIRNEWIILKISNNQFLRFTNKAVFPLIILLLNL